MEKSTETLESAKLAASQSTSIEIKQLKRGDLVMIKERPCKVIFPSKNYFLIRNQIASITRTKYNRYGNTQTDITAVDIFTGLEYRDKTRNTETHMEVPTITTKEYQLINVQEDGSLALMLDDGSVREDLKFAIENDSIRGVILN